jgi:AraC-like DNA-binding protein
MVHFCHLGPFYFKEDIPVVETYEIMTIIQLIQCVTHSNWRPDEIHFTFKRLSDIEQDCELQPSQIKFNQSQPKIIFPKSLLNKEIKFKQFSLLPDKTLDLPTVELTFSEQLLKIMQPYLGDRKINIGLAAELAGISPRSIQRLLQSEQTSFSGILASARLYRAAELLRTTDLKLVDISAMLGFEEQPNFNRAFKSWTGCTPSQYRKQYLS